MSALTVLDRLRIFSLRDLFAHPVRHLVSIAVVTVCSALLVAVLGIYNSIVGSVDDLADDISGNVSLQVTGDSGGGVPAEFLSGIRRADGVKIAAPLVISTVPVNGRPALLLGVDASMGRVQSRLGQTILDQAAASSGALEGGGVLTGPAISAQPGQSLNVAGASTDVLLSLTGEVPERINGGRFVIAPMKFAQKVLGRDKSYDSILIVTDPGVSVDHVRAAVDSATERRVVTSEPLLRTAQSGTILTFLRNALLLCASLAVIVAVLLVFNTMNMAIIRRRAAFATMRAIGARRSEIVRYVCGEAVAIGTAGGLLGIPLGVAAGYLTISRLPAAIAQSVVARIAYHFPAYAVPVALVVSVSACVVAALGGVQVAGKVSPVEAVSRGDLRQMDEKPQPWRFPVGVASMILLVGSTACALFLDNGLVLVACAVFLLGGLGVCYAFAEVIVGAVAWTARRIGPPGAMAALVIERARGRIWVTTMVVVVAVSVGICASGALSNMVGTASTMSAPLQAIPLTVTSTGSDEIPAGATLPSDVEARIAQLPDVLRVIPTQYSSATLGGKHILLQGVSPGGSTVSFRTLDERSRGAVYQGDGVVISRQLAKELGIGKDEELVLPSPTGDRHVRVIAQVDYISVDAGLVVMSLDLLEAWYGRHGATALEVHLRPGADIARAQRTVADVVPAGLHVYRGQQLYDGAMGAVAQVGVLAVAIQLIVAIVVAVGVFTTLLLGTIERRREIAVFQAIGARREFIYRSVLAETTAIALVGGLLGTGIGLITQYIAVKVLSTSITVAIGYRPVLAFLAYPVMALAICAVGATGAILHIRRTSVIESLGDQ